MVDRYDKSRGAYSGGASDDAYIERNRLNSERDGEYGYGSIDDGLRASSAAGGYRKDAPSSPSHYSRFSYGDSASRNVFGDQDVGDFAAERYTRSHVSQRSHARRDAAERQAVSEQEPKASRRRTRHAAVSNESTSEYDAIPEGRVKEEAPRVQPVQPIRPTYDTHANFSRSSETYAVKKKRGKGLKIALIAVLVLVLAGVGAAFAYMGSLSNRLQQDIDEDTRAALVHTDMANQPFYVLLLGTDKSADRDETGEFGDSYRSDSMILARIDPVQRKVSMVSIPRDTLVDLGGKYGYQKINAAYAYGGSALAVQAVSKLAGVNIAHYAEIDFDGFAAIVDAIGGIEVDVPVDIDDWKAGGSLSAGPQTLDGDQALILCRTRETYAATSTAPDLVRAANQRLVLSAIAHKLLASNVATIASTINAVADYVTTDMGLNDIIGIAQTMQGLDSSKDIYTVSFPTDSCYIMQGNAYTDSSMTSLIQAVDPSIDEGYYLVPNNEEWAAMKKRMDSGQPPSTGTVIDEATGTVLATAGADAADITEKYCTIMVKNGTDIKGQATTTANKLSAAGFVNVVVGEIVDSFDYPETVVVYDDPSRASEAELIVKTIGQGRAMLNDGSYIFDNDFLVVIGDDWKANE